MFTGLVLGIGRVVENRPRPGGTRLLRVAIPSSALGRLAVGSSVAIAGVCLTVVEVDLATAECGFEVSPETLRRTRLGALSPGDAVNVEPALRLGDELGGHWVQGHVDGAARVTGWKTAGEYVEAWFDLRPGWETLVVEKGSIALDGVSLTVAGVQTAAFAAGSPATAPGSFWVALVPHTLAVTTLGGLRVGDEVHVELDILGKYVARQIEGIAARRLGGG